MTQGFALIDDQRYPDDRYGASPGRRPMTDDPLCKEGLSEIQSSTISPRDAHRFNSSRKSSIVVDGVGRN